MRAQNQITFTFPVIDFKRIETPLDKQGYRNYVCVVDVLELPDDMKKWNSGSNVRDAKSRGRVPTEIRESLLENPLFGYMNRGIALIADSVKFNNQNNLVEVRFVEDKKHGVADGGHTRLIISEEKQALLQKIQAGDDTANRFVRIEIMTGFNISEITDIVGARNTSNQVKEQSLLELENKFNDLKDALRDEHYKDDIKYKEFELYPNTDVEKPINVQDIVAIMYMFNRDEFTGQKHPVASYSGKSQCLKHFKEHCENRSSVYLKIYPILPDILKLYDEVYLRLPELYNQASKDIREDVTKGSFGRLTGVGYYDGKLIVDLPFARRKSAYRIPISFIYPILASFRIFLDNTKSGYSWLPGFDPIALLESGTGLDYAIALSEIVLKDQNPNKTGKNTMFWSNCYKVAENARLKMEIEYLKKNQKKSA